jgi:hypothetical protein
MKITKNFSDSELKCKGGKRCCGGLVKYDPALAQVAQEIRDDLGVAVNVNSGYRCPKHNAAVGGSKGSDHMRGRAMDLSSPAGYVALLGAAKKALIGKPEFYLLLYPAKKFVHLGRNASKNLTGVPNAYRWRKA